MFPHSVILLQFFCLLCIHICGMFVHPGGEYILCSSAFFPFFFCIKGFAGTSFLPHSQGSKIEGVVCCTDCIPLCEFVILALISKTDDVTQEQDA